MATERNAETRGTEQVASLTSSIRELQEQTAQLQQKLQFASKAEARAQKAAWETRCRALKKSLADAESEYNTCKETLAGIRAAIAQLTMQLAEGHETDKEEIGIAIQVAKAEYQCMATVWIYCSELIGRHHCAHGHTGICRF